MYRYEPTDPFRTRSSRLGLPEYYHVTSMYGSFTVHESRCLTFRNGTLPENVYSSTYQMWGVPEYVRIYRAVRDAETAHSTAPKLMERSVQPIYKMKDLSTELATEEGEDFLLKRLQAIDLARGVMNTMAIDADGEDYSFAAYQFSGVNDVLSASCSMLSAVSNIPQAILFGQAVGGLSTTDDTAMENYYNYIERIQKRTLKANLQYLLSVIFQAGTHTGEVDEVPPLKVKFNPLWSVSDAEQADLDQKKASIQQTKAATAQIYVDMQAVDPSEVRRKLADSDEFDIETMLDEYEDDYLFGTEIPEELDYLSESDKLKALQEYGPEDAEASPHRPSGQTGQPGAEAAPPDAAAAIGPEAEDKNTDPGTEGSASTAAPAATKLPQDMSVEELQKASEAQEEVKQDEDNIPPSGNGKVASVGVICIENGAFIVAQRKSGGCEGLFCGPGGHIEAGETPKQAAIRETQEEFGITPKDLMLIGYGPEEPETGYTPAVYLCTEWEGEPHPVDGEMGDTVWITPDMVEQLRPSLFPPFADAHDLLMEIITPEQENEDGDSDDREDSLDKDDVDSVEKLRQFILQVAKGALDLDGEHGNIKLDSYPDHPGRPGQVGGYASKTSATGKNEPCVGFEHKKTAKYKLKKHGEEYEGMTLEKECGEDIDGYLQKDGAFVRFDKKTGDFAVGFPGSYLKTMFNPGYKNGKFSLERAIREFEKYLKRDEAVEEEKPDAEE